MPLKLSASLRLAAFSFISLSGVLALLLRGGPARSPFLFTVSGVNQLMFFCILASVTSARYGPACTVLCSVRVKMGGSDQNHFAGLRSRSASSTFIRIRSTGSVKFQTLLFFYFSLENFKMLPRYLVSTYFKPWHLCYWWERKIIVNWIIVNKNKEIIFFFNMCKTWRGIRMWTGILLMPIPDPDRHQQVKSDPDQHQNDADPPTTMKWLHGRGVGGNKDLFINYRHWH